MVKLGFSPRAMKNASISCSKKLKNAIVMKMVKDLRITRLGRRDFKIKREYKYSQNPKADRITRGQIQQREDEEDKAKEDEKTTREIMKVANVHLVVATLLVTVTFAASFKLPGGFDSDPGPNQGMAILIRKAAFRAFIVTNAIAFTCSVAGVFSYFVMASYATMFHKKMTYEEPFYDSNCIATCGYVSSCNWYICYFSTFN